MIKVLTNPGKNVLAEHDSIQGWRALGGSGITARQGRPGTWETLPARVVSRDDGAYFKVGTDSTGRRTVTLCQGVEIMVWGRQLLVESDELVWTGDLSPQKRYIVLYIQLNLAGTVFTASFGARSSTVTWDERGSEGVDLSQQRGGWSQVDLARWTTDDPVPELIGAPVPHGVVERTSTIETETFLDHNASEAGQVKKATHAETAILARPVQDAIKGLGAGALAILKPKDQLVTAFPDADGFTATKAVVGDITIGQSMDVGELVGVSFSIAVEGRFSAWIEFEPLYDSSVIIPTVLPPNTTAEGTNWIPPTTRDTQSSFTIESIGTMLLPDQQGCYRFLFKWPNASQKPFDVIHVDINNVITSSHQYGGHDAVVWNGPTLSSSERQNWRSINLTSRFLADTQLGEPDDSGAVTIWKLKPPTLATNRMTVEVESSRVADILNGEFSIDISKFNWTVPGPFTFVNTYPLGLIAKRIKVKAAGNLSEEISATIITAPGSGVTG